MPAVISCHQAVKLFCNPAGAFIHSQPPEDLEGWSDKPSNDTLAYNLLLLMSGGIATFDPGTEMVKKRKLGRIGCSAII